MVLVHLKKGVGPQSDTGQICVRDPSYCERDIFGNIPREDFLTVSDEGRVTVHMGPYTSASVYIPEDTPSKTQKVSKKAGKDPR